MGILEIENLHVGFQKDKEYIDVLKGVNLCVEEHTTLALVGESGCGKTQTARCIIKLLSTNAIIKEGKILFKGNDILHMDEEELLQMRRNQIAMIFQNPQAVLDPVFTIGKQLEECIKLQYKDKKIDVKAQVEELLEIVQIADGKRIMRSFPFQLSLGMCQRIMIAMAMASQAQFWIVDEATSALDGNVQADILALLNKLKSERKLSLLLITHDLRILPRMSDEIAIMFDGEIIEVMKSEQLLDKEAIHHPYTQTLLQALSFEGQEEPHEADDIQHHEGCAYASRCSHCQQICLNQKPKMKSLSEKQRIQCHLI